MKNIRKCGPSIEAIKILNRTRKGCLPESCQACRFFSEETTRDVEFGFCRLARNPLVEEFTDPFGFDCPLEHMEGVDERIWGIEDTNPWVGPWETEVLPDEINAHKARVIGKLIDLLKAEWMVATGLDVYGVDKSKFLMLTLVESEEDFNETFEDVTLPNPNEVYKYFSARRRIYVDKNEIAMLEDISNAFPRLVGDDIAEYKKDFVPVYLVKATLKNGREYLFISADGDASDIQKTIG